MVTGKLSEISTEVHACTQCALHKTRTNTVPGEGDPTAKLMFIGEAPGAQEDETGRPFVGRSGKLLTELIESIGLTREQVFITSINKCRPPENRNPSTEEQAACIPYLERQVEAINPKLIVLLGNVAMHALLHKGSMKDSHGQVFEKDGEKYFPTYHPAAGLRSPIQTKAKLEKDFQKLKELLNQT